MGHWKRVLCMILSVVLCVSFLEEGQVYAARKSLQTGITLDCARRYYSVADLKEYIRLVSGSGESFLQLHLTDNENVGVECLFLGQTVKNARKLSDGSYQNRKTGKKFLSREQMRELVAYAEKRQVELIPEIDMPAHMGGFFALACQAFGSKYVKRIARDNERYPGELNIGSKRAMKFAKQIYGEYGELFAGCRYFHMGCDEFSPGCEDEVVKYINTMSEFLQKKGFTVRIWNDLLRKKNIKRIHHNIQVTYWSYDGDSQSVSQRRKRRKVRASAADLQREGFSILNYNSYYLYYTPSRANCNKRDRKYMVQDLKKNWNIRKWDQDSTKELSKNRNIIGAAVSVWGEDSTGLSARKIYQQVKPLYQAMERKTREK